MNTVEVDKEKLLATLQANKAEHAKDFEEATQAYNVKLVKLLERRLEQAKEDPENFEINFNLVKPQNHEEDYDQAIEMVNWEVNDTINLQRHEFENLVQDNWQWGHQFAMSYLSNTGHSHKMG